MSRFIVAASLPLLLLLCCYQGETRAFFGLSSSLSGSSNNGTSILAALALAHAHHTINRLEQLAELMALGQNFTASILTS